MIILVEYPPGKTPKVLDDEPYGRKNVRLATKWNKVYAHETYACEMHTREVHAHEMHTNKVHGREIHVHQMHAM